MELTYDLLFTFILNTRDQHQFLQGVRQFMTILYEDPFSVEESARKLFVPGVDNWFISVMNDISDKSILRARSEQMIDYVSRLSVCVCDVAQPMRSDFYRSFVVQVREYAQDPHMLLDLRILPSVLGGIRFSYKGLNYDFTLLGDFLRTWHSSDVTKVGV